MRSRAALLLLVTLAGCVLDPVDLDGRSCPCIEGWICDEVRDRCVRSLPPPDDAAVDDAAMPADATMLADAAMHDAADGATAPDDSAVDDAGAPLGCATVAGATFCEDFETGDLDRWTLVDARDGGALEWSDAGRSGLRAIRLRAPAAGATMLLTTSLSIAQPEIHFRAWLRVPAGASGAPLAFELAAGEFGAVRGRLVTAGNALEISAGAAGSDPSTGASGPAAWTADEWICVRGRVVRGPAARGRVEIRTAAGSLAELRSISTDYGAAFDTFSIGVIADGPSELDVDDVVWSTRELDCD